MRRNGIGPFAVLAAALMVAVAAAPMLATGNTSGYYLGTCEVDVQPGEEWTWTPELNLAVSSLGVSASGSDITNVAGATYSASSGYARVQGGAVKVTIGQDYAGSSYFVAVKATSETPAQSAYYKIKFNVGGQGGRRGGYQELDRVAVYAIKNETQVGVGAVPLGAGETLTGLSMTTNTVYKPQIGETKWGMTFGADGSIAGTPTYPNAYQFYQAAETSAGRTLYRMVEVTVENRVAVSGPDSLAAYRGTAGSATYTCDAVANVQWSLGQVISPSGASGSGKFSVSESGTLTVAADTAPGSYSVQVRATSALSATNTATKTVSVKVSEPVAIDERGLDFYAVAGSGQHDPLTLTSSGPEAVWQAVYGGGVTPQNVTVSQAGAVALGEIGFSTAGEYSLTVKAVAKYDQDNHDEAQLRIHVTDMLRFVRAPTAAMHISEFSSEESS